MDTDRHIVHPTTTTAWSGVVWFLVGTAVGGFLLFTQAVATDGVNGLLQVGAHSPLRPLIERELGDVPVSSAGGHDGQISFAIAIDPAGHEVPSLLQNATGYRYRRILYPALSSLFGSLSGPPVLWMMATLAALGMGLATAGIHLLAEQMVAPLLVVLSVLANPGVWLAVRVLTPDALGFGLALLGLALAVRRLNLSAVAVLAAAALAKEQFLLVAIGVSIWSVLDRDRPRAALYLLGPATPLAAWSLVLSVRLGGGFDPRNSLDIPGRGILRAIPNWWANPTDGVLAWATLSLVVALAYALVRSRDRLLASVGWPWVALALVSSSAVWEFGNNSFRALAILGPLFALATWGRERPSGPRADSMASHG